LLLLSIPLVVCAAERVTCLTVADTWTTAPAWDQPKSAPDRSHGADAELVVRGRESFALLQFDLTGLKGLTVEKATLRVRRKPEKVPLDIVGISTVSGAGPWPEADSTFLHRGPGTRPWSYAGSDLVDVTFGQGGSLYAYPRARDAGGGWYEVDVSPGIAAALASGDQYGLMLADEKGQTQTRHVLWSRESEFPPVLIVEGTRTDRTAPGPVRALKTGSESTPDEARKLGRTTLRPGSVILRFGKAGDDAGSGIALRYEVRYSEQPLNAGNFESGTTVPRWVMDPLAPKPHPLATANSLRDEVTAVVEHLKPGALYYFAARASDEAGNTGPVAALGRYRAYTRSFPSLPAAGMERQVEKATAAAADPLRVWAVPELLKINPRSGALLEQSDFPDHRARNTVWDAAAARVKLTGARNEFVAFQLAIESAGPVTGIEVAVTRPLFSGAKLPAVFRDTGAVQLYREWFVPDDRNTGQNRPWYPDALVPLEKPIDLPAADNGVPGQTVQPVFVDIYIPHDARPGRHTGALLVRTAGGDRREIALEVEVLPFQLPDRLNFIVDLNCYSGVGGRQAVRGTSEYRKLEHAYHRVAQLHRTNLDVLGYSQLGPTIPDHAPPLDGEGAATRVRTWEDWDAHFAPLLDGSAFADLPRGAAPIPAMYLPFFENWPGDLSKGYKHHNPRIAATEEEYRDIITRHALEPAPIEEAFTREYQERFSAVAAQFAAHIRERGWTKDTRYFVYFNNKYYYKRPAQGGHGSSWWLLDEPNHRDDVRANSFFAYLLRRQLGAYPDVPIRLRTDISRVEWIRDLLAGQIDLNCISGRFYAKNRYLLDDRPRFGREYWNYASTNHPRDTNVAMRAWCWRTWLHGGDGLLPWNAASDSRAWDRAETLTVFYPGGKFGRTEPFASLRLKAYRRGQQDMEYLILLAQKRGWDRDAVTRAVAEALDLSGEIRQSFEEDAGTVRFNRVKDAQLEDLRLRVARALSPVSGGLK
jgi:hypothetical protein